MPPHPVQRLPCVLTQRERLPIVASMSGSRLGGKNKRKYAARRRRKNPPQTLARRAKATLRPLQFSSGVRIGRIELSPQCRPEERQALAVWIRRLPDAFVKRLPPLKLAIAERLSAFRSQLFINQIPTPGKNRPEGHTHAASFIPERYIVFRRELFHRRVELGRIAYHEFCHFVWPRLGNPKRRRFASLLEQELREGVAGEFGYSAEGRKKELPERKAAGVPVSPRRWRDYVCESFCDTGSFVLLGSERRAKHSEYSLRPGARARRCRLWSSLVLGSPRSGLPGAEGGKESFQPLSSLRATRS